MDFGTMDGSRWMNARFYRLLGERGVPLVVAQEHELVYGSIPRVKDPLRVDVWVACRCGWREQWPMPSALTTRDMGLKSCLERHADAVAEAFQPTLAEMAEWGWFSTDVQP